MQVYMCSVESHVDHEAKDSCFVCHAKHSSMQRNLSGARTKQIESQKSYACEAMKMKKIGCPGLNPAPNVTV